MVPAGLICESRLCARSGSNNLYQIKLPCSGECPTQLADYENFVRRGPSLAICVDFT